MASATNRSRKARKCGSNCGRMGTARGRRIGRIKKNEDRRRIESMKTGDRFGCVSDRVATMCVLFALWALFPAAAYGAAASANFEQDWSKLINDAKQEGTHSVSS